MTSSGLIARFATPDALLAAARHVRAAGYTRLDAYVPYGVDGLEEALPGKPTPIGWIMFAAGVVGAGGAYFMQWFAARDYPLNVGGRPLHSWPAFVPVTFELTVLTSAIVGVIALCWLCGFPRLHHPLFAVPGFERASQDRFFLRIGADDPLFRARETRAILAGFAPESIEEVAP
jgi:ActD protein